MIIDLEKRKVLKDGTEIPLTTTEFEILYLLASHPERVYTYQQIYEAIWNEEYVCEKGSIMSYIQRLRKKIESDHRHPKYIENIRGIGYKFVGQQISRQ
ncbi:MAG: winged helix-turn-helix domain-containing protein [Eubacteriales bacterium]|nr:winged helix-turn-helix domain-containing protein [Eubacteriales bacterium]